jgi:hypothetical protein
VAAVSGAPRPRDTTGCGDRRTPSCLLPSTAPAP